MSQLSEITLEYHRISAKSHWISRISHKYPKYQGSDLPDVDILAANRITDITF